MFKHSKIINEIYIPPTNVYVMSVLTEDSVNYSNNIKQ